MDPPNNNPSPSSQQQHNEENNPPSPNNSENQSNFTSSSSLLLDSIPTTDDDENEIILSIVASISRAIDFKYRILNFSNMLMSDKILRIVEISLHDYMKVEENCLNLIWELNVGNNLLSFIPNCLMKFSRVERLLLNDNQIHEIVEKSSLKELYTCRLISLSNNLISSLPLSGNPFPVHSLSRLILSNNQLSVLPGYIGECVNLVELDVSGNRLITIPRELENCKRLMRLYLQNNPIFCVPYELQNLTKLRTFRINNVAVNERFYRNMYSRHETTLLELAKRFIVNSDHLLCLGQCCKMNLPQSISKQSSIDVVDDDLGMIDLDIQPTNQNVSFVPSLYEREHNRGMNFELLKSQYKSIMPKHIHEDLTDHTRLRPCSYCNTLITPNSGIHFIALLKLPKISSNQIENIPHFCRACCEDCFDSIPNKLV